MKSIIKKILNRFTFFPHNKVKLASSEMPECVSEKWINTTDGEKLQAFYFEHKTQTKKSLIVYFHGNTGNIFSHHRFEHAEKLYNMGQNVLLISYRGYSKSSGSPSEEGIFIDGESALNYAKNTLGFNLQQIFVFGRSLGSTVATHVAQNKKLKGVVLLTPLTSAKEMARFMGFRYFSFLAQNRFNSIKKIKYLKSKLLIIHGTDDKQIPFAMGEKLYHKFKGKKKLVTIEDGGHNNIQIVNPDLFWNSIGDFLNL